MSMSKRTGVLTAAVLMAAMFALPPAIAAEQNFDPTAGETAWGNYVADAMRAHYKSDIAVIDAGTLATLVNIEIVAEDLTRLDIAEVEVALVRLTGRDLAEILSNAAKFYPRKNNGFLQISGMTVSLDANQRQNKVTGASVGGAPIDPDKVYTVAVTKFLANGGASFGILERVNMVDGSVKFIGDIIAAYYAINKEMPPAGVRYIVRGG